MIAGIFVRNIKCYSNLNFIPFIQSTLENISVLIGGNGAGKSTLLDSLHCIMNRVEPKLWDTTIGQKKDRSHICPVFLIEKSKIRNDPKLEAISNCFWNHDFFKLNQTDSTKSFVSWRDNLKDNIDHEKYYLIAIGKDYNGGTILTSTFHKKICDQTKRNSVSKQFIIETFNNITSLYSYIYIPVESRINDVLSLQANEMQNLMDKSIIDEIRNIFERKDHKQEGSPKKFSIVDLINKNLDGYITEINEKISDGYSFNPRGAYKQNIKPNDIVKVVLEEYFSIRPLTKDGKSINSLSSGQQRLALIDVASTLLSSESDKSKEIILAIDEPESSLEATQRFRQFDRLINISEKFDHQIMLTTHWYGLLLRPSKGRLLYIDDSESFPVIRSYGMNALFNNRRRFPNSLEMKSYFDLMSSMLSILKNGEENWIICEGLEDAIYLDTYLEGKINNLHILPFNGSGNVKKLFDFLSVPFSDKDECEHIQGKVLCLIDTDSKSTITIPGYHNNNYNKKLGLSRLMLDREKQEAHIISVANTNSTNTEIEDLLDSTVLWNVLKSISKIDDNLERLLSYYELNKDYKYSDLTLELGMLNPTSIEGYQSKKELKELLSSEQMKSWIAHEYSIAYSEKDQPEPQWIKQIIDFFN